MSVLTGSPAHKVATFSHPDYLTPAVPEAGREFVETAPSDNNKISAGDHAGQRFIGPGGIRARLLLKGPDVRRDQRKLVSDQPFANPEQVPESVELPDRRIVTLAVRVRRVHAYE